MATRIRTDEGRRSDAGHELETSRAPFAQRRPVGQRKHFSQGERFSQREPFSQRNLRRVKGTAPERTLAAGAVPGKRAFGRCVSATDGEGRRLTLERFT
jgi:hypothetical protein